MGIGESRKLVSQEEWQEFVFLIENRYFSNRFRSLMYLLPVLTVVVFLIAEGAFYFNAWFMFHMFVCMLASFWLGYWSMRRRVYYVSCRFDKYSAYANVLRELYDIKSFRKLLTKPSLPFKELAYFEYFSWMPREMAISLVSFVLNAIPVLLPMGLFLRRARSGSFILYPMSLLFTTYGIYWLGSYVMWTKKLKGKLQRIV